MSRNPIKRRTLLPDPKFNDQLVTRFVNNMLKSQQSTYGKKH